MFLRNDTPGCIRHEKGDTFSEIYLSYLGGPKGVRIPSSEFFAPFPPDLKFGYRRDTHRTPEHFIRAYHLRDKQTGKDGPWLAGLTLDPSVVYEAWCSQRPGGIIVMIEEIHGRPVKAGESFSAAHIVGYFDTIEEMHKVYDRYKGHTALTADAIGLATGEVDLGPGMYVIGLPVFSWLSRVGPRFHANMGTVTVARCTLASPSRRQQQFGSETGVQARLLGQCQDWSNVATICWD